MPDLGHLPAPVRTGLVVDDHDVVDQQHAGADGEAGPAGEVLGPRDRLGPQLEGVEVDVAEPQHGRPQLVAARAALLDHHPVLHQRAHDAVRRRRCQVEPGRRARTGSSAGRPGARSARGSRGRRTGSRVRASEVRDTARTKYAERSCGDANHRCNVRASFDNIECRSRLTSTIGVDMLDETTMVQKLTAEAHRHRVPGVHRRRIRPRHLDRERGRAVHHGRSRHDLPGLRHDRDRHRLRPRAHRRQPHQPGRDARASPSPASSPGRRCPAYIAAQVVGAIVGAAAIIGVLGHKASDVGLGVASYSGISWVQAFTAEFVGTFILVFTIFGVIHRKAAAGFAGVAIGLVVFAAIIPVAPATGASINPARTVGPMLVQQIAGGDREVGAAPGLPGRRAPRRRAAGRSLLRLHRPHARRQRRPLPRGSTSPIPKTRPSPRPRPDAPALRYPRRETS